MSLSLGEKLRTAREERGISISEVAEQTRISPLYLEAIDSDNYKTLPGGIFNKGFVRSYAKYVGVDEQEALQDYSRLIAENTAVEESDFKTYRPEVLTDDRAASSIVPTVIFAAVILGLMTAGILFLVNYIQNQQSEPPIAANTANTNVVAPTNSVAPIATPPVTAGQAPTMGTVKVEFKTSGEDIWLNSVTDGTSGSTIVSADKPATFEPKQQLRLSYSKSLAQAAQLTINGKPITLPASPSNPKRQLIELDISSDNLATVWQNAGFTTDTAQPVTEANTNIGTVNPPVASRPTPRPAETQRPVTTANVNTASTPASPPAMTNRPAPRATGTPVTVKPAANSARPN